MLVDGLFNSNVTVDNIGLISGKHISINKTKAQGSILVCVCEDCCTELQAKKVLVQTQKQA